MRAGALRGARVKLGIPAEMALADAVAVIDEARCIGCTLCIQACPVDAIVGAAKLMHTVVEAACTGCELCMAPCPVDCIVMRPVTRPQGVARAVAADAARRRCEARNLRYARLEAQNAAASAARRAAAAEARTRATIAQALDRARQRLRSRA
jgi:electron transport complex protein RnfB